MNRIPNRKYICKNLVDLQVSVLTAKLMSIDRRGRDTGMVTDTNRWDCIGPVIPITPQTP